MEAMKDDFVTDGPAEVTLKFWVEDRRQAVAEEEMMDVLVEGVLTTELGKIVNVADELVPIDDEGILALAEAMNTDNLHVPPQFADVSPRQ